MKRAASVSGPGVDRTFPAAQYGSLDGALRVALSYAQNAAVRHEGVATFYVRDDRDRLAYRLERDERGVATHTIPGDRS